MKIKPLIKSILLKISPGYQLASSNSVQLQNLKRKLKKN